MRVVEPAAGHEKCSCLRLFKVKYVFTLHETPEQAHAIVDVRWAAREESNATLNEGNDGCRPNCV